MTYIPTSRRDYYSQGCSNSHLAAKEDSNKLTAGQAAQLLTKRLGIKVLAKDIKHLATEWHHTGAFGKGKAGKTYWFTYEQVEAITQDQIEAKKEADVEMVNGWFIDWFKAGGKWKASIGLYSGPAAKAPKRFNELSDQDWAEAQFHKDRVLAPYEEPNWSAYKAERLAKQKN